MVYQITDETGDLRPEQLTPHSIEAEEAVLGSILINPNSLYEIEDKLNADDFFIVRHAWMWEAISALSERKAPIDYVTIVKELESADHLAEMGGAAWVLSLINKTPSALNIEGYADIVECTALRRRLIEAAGQIARVAHSEETEIEDVLDAAETAIQDVVSGRVTDENIPIAELISREIDRRTAFERGEYELSNVAPHLIDVRRGPVPRFRNGYLIYLAARPGMGKTSEIECEILYNAERGIPVGFISIEMDSEIVVQRLIAKKLGWTFTKVADEKFDPNSNDAEKFLRAGQEIAQLPIYIYNHPNPTNLQIRTVAREWVYTEGVQMIFGDYIQLARMAGRYESRRLEIEELSRSQKILARELKIPIMWACQLSRALESRPDKRPLMSDLKEASGLEQDADVVIFLYRDHYYNPNTADPGLAEYIISKHRNGDTGIVNVMWDGAAMSYRDLIKGEPLI